MKFTLTALLLASVSIFTSCVSPVKVDYVSQAAHKFGSYQCYAIDSREERSQYHEVALTPAEDRRIHDQLDAVLKARGYADTCTSPDFRVTYCVRKDTKTEITTKNTSGAGRGVGYVFRENYTFQVNKHEIGTLILHIIDVEREEVVWEGSYSKLWRGDAPSDEKLHQVISETLAKFPPVN